MKNNDKTKRRLFSEAHKMAKDLHSVGAIPLTTMREFDAQCLSKIHELTPKKIKIIRKNAGVSQPVFAKILNISLATIKQWERGERKPTGAALKLLNIVEKNGIEYVM